MWAVPLSPDPCAGLVSSAHEYPISCPKAGDQRKYWIVPTVRKIVSKTRGSQCSSSASIRLALCYVTQHVTSKIPNTQNYDVSYRRTSVGFAPSSGYSSHHLPLHEDRGCERLLGGNRNPIGSPRGASIPTFHLLLRCWRVGIAISTTCLSERD